MTKADIVKSLHQLFVLVCVSEIVAAVYQILECYFTAHEHFAWAYSKTNNIWVPVILHFLNNNLSLVLANDYSPEVLQQQQVTWNMIPSLLLLNGVLFGLFLFTKEFQQKE